ncbi:MAG: hypothetical protein M3410_08070 [Acidobacteriota bacterium]|nr:hypothetical protein [Acidobacteriota bacterium]
MLVFHAPAAIVLGHVNLVTIFDRAAEAELQRNGFADAELPPIIRNRYFEDNVGVDRRRGLSAGMPDGHTNKQEGSKETHILTFAERLNIKNLLGS